MTATRKLDTTIRQTTSKPMRRRSLLTVFAVVVLTLTAPPSYCAAISSVVAFGDSLTDAGRLGRFTDDVLWIEELALQLGVPIPRPSNRGGTNFAASGAATENITIAPDMDQQVANYLFLHTPSQHELFALWGGHNDLFGGADPARIVQNLSNLVTSIHAAGGRQFLVPTLAPINVIPRERGGPNEAVLAAEVALTNSLLLNEMNRLRTTLPGTTIYVPDIHDFILEMIADFEAFGSSGAYGFENVTDAALLTGGDVTAYMWLDPVHPTSKTHAYIGAYIASVIPEPTSLHLFLLIGLMITHRNTARRKR